MSTPPCLETLVIYVVHDEAWGSAWIINCYMLYVIYERPQRFSAMWRWRCVPRAEVRWWWWLERIEAAWCGCAGVAVRPGLVYNISSPHPRSVAAQHPSWGACSFSSVTIPPQYTRYVVIEPRLQISTLLHWSCSCQRGDLDAWVGRRGNNILLLLI